MAKKLFPKFTCYWFLLFFFPAYAMGQSLTVSYPERPPYYFTTDKKVPAGSLYELTDKILNEAGIDAQYVSLTIPQIFYVIKYAREPHCSIGWFRTPERELFAKFSEPFFKNNPMVLLTRTALSDRFEEYDRVEQVLADQKLVMAKNVNYSYGQYVDSLLQKLRPKILPSVQTQAELVQAIYHGKADYLLISPEEAEELIRSSKGGKETFTVLSFSDLQRGNERRLMCNQAISDSVLERINDAIDRVTQINKRD